MDIVSSQAQPARPVTVEPLAGRSPVFFASPSKVLVARPGDVVERYCGKQAVQHAQQTMSSLPADKGGRARMVGALPFLPDAPAMMAVVLGHGAADCHAPTNDAAMAASDLSEYRARLVPSPAAFTAAVAQAVERIRAGDATKVVLSRCVDMRLSATVDVSAVVARLWAGNPYGFTYGLDVTPPPLHPAGSRRRHRTMLVGASPELLLRKSGAHIVSNPLAGSAPRSSHQAEDQRRAQTLLTSGKDLREHRVVVEQIADTLSPFCKRLHVPRVPDLLSTGAMWHLSTRVEGELRDGDRPSIELARTLHPTPAVCGAPTPAARDVIDDLEPFDRGYFTGLVGHSDCRGDGEWAVTIRCAQVTGRSVRMYAGAGIVDGSEPLAELLETRAKLDTVLGALGLATVAQAV